MNISRQFALGIATGTVLVFMLGLVTVSHSVHQSHMRLFLYYFWMALYFLIAVAVVFLVNSAFRIAIISYLPAVEVDHPFLSGIAGVVISVVLFWLAFWRLRLFLGIAAALVLIALGLIRFKWRTMGWLRH